MNQLTMRRPVAAHSGSGGWILERLPAFGRLLARVATDPAVLLALLLAGLATGIGVVAISDPLLADALTYGARLGLAAHGS